MFCGFIFTGLGLIGIIVPGLPTTPFMILAAYCFMKSSDRLYKWVITNKLFGKRVKKFLDNKAISLWGKISCISAMWIMIIITIIFFIDLLWIRILLTVIGLGASLFLISIKTLKE
ncbi:MAG: YbaN family protein [Bacteroidota bacterium]